MQKEQNHLGGVIKAARTNKHLTRNQLANALGISARHLLSIENENQKPSYDVLFSIIRELHIPADLIFYPELGYEQTEKLRLLFLQCDEKEIAALYTALQALMEKSQQ
jgi:transcriptional regulator with XRE-family HTH domain